MDPRIKQLSEAKDARSLWDERWSNYMGNNPNKYQAQLKYWRGEVDRLERVLKMEGVLPATDEEKLHFELDRTFPQARSREVVELRGQKFRRRFSPAEFSRSRQTVTRWNKWWEMVDAG